MEDKFGHCRFSEIPQDQYEWKSYTNLFFFLNITTKVHKENPGLLDPLAGMELMEFPERPVLKVLPALKDLPEWQDHEVTKFDHFWNF